MADHFDSNITNSGVYVSAQNSSIRGDHRTLPNPDPLFTFVFYIIRKNYFTEPRTRSQTVSHTRHTFEYPISRLESQWNSVPIARMLSSMRIPFRFQNPFWSLDDEAQSASNPSPLRNRADVVREISEFARRIIRETRGYHKVRMTVMIEKRVVVSDSQILTDEHRPPSPSNDNSSSVSSTRTELRRSLGTGFGGFLSTILEVREALTRLRSNPVIDDLFVPLPNEAMERAIVGLNPPIDDDMFEPIPDEAFEVEVFGLNPAAKSAVEALEKLTYDGSSSSDSNTSDASTLICPICVEEVMIGSQLVRMPCPHMFHQDCILEWLKRSHTCPVCRFQLPT